VGGKLSTIETKFVEWARREALSFAGDGDEAAEHRFAEMIGSAQIVAIGESFHHTHEFPRLRAKLVHFLVSRLEFRSVFLEAVRPGANPIDTFVAQGVGTAEAALIETKARMWRNRETQELVEWLRARSLAEPASPVRIMGMDILAPGHDLRRVISALPQLEGRGRLEQLSFGFDEDGRADQVFYNGLSQGDRKLLHDTFDDPAKLYWLSEELSSEERRALWEHAIVVQQALAGLRAGGEGWVKSFALRDRALAQNVVRLVERSDPSERFIVLSHNAHIRAEVAPGSDVVPLGVRLRQHFGSRYLAIGTTFGGASFDPPIYGTTTMEAGNATLDSLVHCAQVTGLILDLRRSRGDTASLLLERTIAMAGNGNSPCVPTAAFDLVCHVERLTNASQIIGTELDLDPVAVDASRPVDPHLMGEPLP
jgi:erythromycin esterase